MIQPGQKVSLLKYTLHHMLMIDPPPLCFASGLISAAKFVALATGQLVAAASKLVDGELKEADLIAASKVLQYVL